MRKELSAEEAEVEKQIKETKESISDEDEDEGYVSGEGFDVSEKEIEEGLAAVQKRMDEVSPER